MKERPIIFSAPMVRAILDGRKTQTRRVVKPSKIRGLPDTDRIVFDAEDGLWYCDGGFWMMHCPYGVPGDRLYVRHGFDLFPVYCKPIVGWDGLYAAGTNGMIYRMDGAAPDAVIGTPTDRGYLSVSMSRGEAITKSVHRLVCETFYGPPPYEGAQVRHMDGVRTNNRPENLDWGTQEDNWQDRKAHGRGMGEQHHSSKLTAADAHAIRRSNLSQRALAAQYGVSQSTIGEIRAGKSWAEHALGPRNMPAWKPWLSPIHMPRWASRLTLEIVSVRVERVQEISEGDCWDEGIEEWLNDDKNLPRYSDGTPGKYLNIKQAFRALWDSINAKRAAWESNPWVWVIEFRRAGE